MTKYIDTFRAVLTSTSLAFILLTTGCNLSDITDSAKSIDGEAIPPQIIESAEGARWVYLGALAKFNRYYGLHSDLVARFTDELSLVPEEFQNSLDVRENTVATTEGPYIEVYRDLTVTGQTARVQLEQAAQLIGKYGGETEKWKQAKAYALLSMVYMMNADVFCSGYAISESNWGGELVLGKGLPTDSLYLRAVASADKGIALETDSASINHFLRGLKARALNSLGQYKNAHDIAVGINDDYSIGETFSFSNLAGDSVVSYHPYISISDNYHILNRKGSNGLKWIADAAADQDMRIPVRVSATGNYVYPILPIFAFTNRKISFFSGAEARLIEAEYYLNVNDPVSFMEKINSVRKMYRRQSGATVQDTTDPGTHEARVDLLFRERAYTFYITGRRLGDMRRLVRQYSREANSIWPVGRSEGASFILYGDNYVFVPEVQGKGQEANNNPNYNACESYDP